MTKKKGKELEKYFKDKKYRNKVSKKIRKRNFYFTVAIYALVITVVLFIGWLIYLSQTLPSLSDLENPRLEEATKIYSDNGELIDKFYLKNRTRITYDDLPQDLINALIATEDRKFFDHWGVDIQRIVQAFFKNLVRFSLTREGASTITQQLARNLYLDSKETTLNRKLREAMTAVQIEKTYTKQEILVYYVNTVYFGKGAYGVEAASQTFYNKTVRDLTLNECATLVGLLKSPANYDPIDKPEAAINRRNTVLNSMYECGFITNDVLASVSEETIKISPRQEERREESEYSDFTEYVRQLLQIKAEKYGFDLYRDGLKVYTTLDTRMQNHAENSVKEQLKPYQSSFNSYWNWKNNKNILNSNIDKFIKQSEEYKKCRTNEEKSKVYEAMKSNNTVIDSVKKLASTIQVGFVVMDVKTGYIRALVGSNPYTRIKYGLNHVTQIKRQPGSAFKPFVYAVAINKGYSPAYSISNDPLTVNIEGKNWTPKGGGTGGLVTMRRAIERSINVVAVRTALDIAPISEVIALANEMGIKSSLPNYPSLALGVGEVSPLEITNAFGTFANGGIWVEPVAITKIEDRNGRIIEDISFITVHKEVLSEGAAYIMCDMMEGVIDNGTATSVRQFFHRPAAGKTGTSQSYTDAWFVGFTPQFVAGCWLGFDDARIKFGGAYGQGGKAAAPIWGRFMKKLYSDDDFDFPVEYFLLPDDVEELEICMVTGLLANSTCPSQLDVVLKKFMPRKCNMTHYSVPSYDSTSTAQSPLSN
ncbi:MAG: PBP1A family penicillin-binding protein [Ignavibacteria bacterium]|nr:PBP1A family penicillin-binding protein [Ignavibacteria bacterium]